MRDGTDERYETLQPVEPAMMDNVVDTAANHTLADSTETPAVVVSARQARGALGPSAMRYLRQQTPRIAPWAMALFAVVLIGMLGTLFADTRTIDAVARPTATATPQPTVTPVPTVTPAPIDGFQFYHDSANRYVVQYPLGWEVSSSNATQGIEFCDDCTNPGYFVQVNTPSNLGDAGPPPNENNAEGWVNYALSGLKSFLQTGTLTTTGRQQPITIGGVVWQSGGGVVTDPSGSIRLRVQVYATVYEDKPYILVLSTTEDRFTAGTIQFFGPMLQSFQFVQQAP
jgi:hypothetical protein